MNNNIMIEELERKIKELEVRTLLWRKRTKHIIDKELPDARKEFFAAKFEQDKLFEIPERELTELDRDLLIKLRKEVPELRSYYRKLREDLDGYIERSDNLEEELEELKRRLPPPTPVEVPELIDIDDDTGYLILYSPTEKAYFKLRPQDYEEGKIEVEKYFSTLEIAVNFTFDTQTTPQYEGGPTRYLEAEVRIVARVREAGRELSLAIPAKLKKAFERHITFFFEQGYDRRDAKGIRKASPWTGGIQHIIAKGIKYKGKHKIKSEVEHNVEVGKKISEMLGVKVLKVGLFYRINDDKPNMIIEEEYARPVVTGEWSRQNYSESISKEFDVEHELGQPLHWSMVRGFVGESGWEQLKRIKEEQK